jgi:low temperature requirement protein LtrA
MPSTSESGAESPPITRVSTLELFFDLVFVLVITRLTQYVVQHPTWAGAGRAALIFAVIWWMYGGFAWLTNSVQTDRWGRRVALLTGMAGFLVMALYVPLVFDDGNGLPFGIAYLAVTSIHAALFARAADTSVVRAVFRIAPLNTLAALLVLAGTAVGGTPAYVLFGIVVIACWAISGMVNASGFSIGAEHFVERHGLVVIVAIGESVVAISAGITGTDIGAATVITALIALAISAALWWVYFGGDDRRAERALGAVGPERRGRVALTAFGHAHFVMLFGIVLLAAGVKKAIGEPTHALHGAGPALLAGGAALFLIGEASFRRILRIGSPGVRTVLALAIVATIPLGQHASGLAQAAAIAGLFGLLFVVERSTQPR